MDSDCCEELHEDESLLGTQPVRSVTSLRKGQKTSHNDASSRGQWSSLFFNVMLFLSSFSLMLLIGFIFYQWSRPSPFPPQSNSTEQGNSDEVQITNILPSQPAFIIPPSDHFNLRNTGFTISNETNKRDFVFNITHQLGAPDGVNKSMILVNGQSPGPLIEANTGDTIRVVVHNSMTNDKTTIHWHGIDQKDSVWMDGIYGVTQCGIPPGETFTYEFNVTEQRGSFWYHAHVSGQYTDGLYGPLIIHDPDEKIPPVDDDKIIMMGDLYHMTGKEAMDEYLGPSPSWSPNMPGMEPPPDNIIINGRNVFNCFQSASRSISHEHESHRQTYNRQTPVRCSSGSIYSTRIKSRNRARLRLISHSSNIPLWFTIDNHTLEIVEIDGVEVEPIATTRVFVNPGQRYSVLLTANQTAGNFLMHASAARNCAMLGGNFATNLASVNYESTGILSYDDIDIGAESIGRPWSLDSTFNPDVGQEPWTLECQDLPFDLARPMRTENAYDIGERNQHHFRFEMLKTGGSFRSFIDGSVFSPLEHNASLWKASDQDLSPENIESADPKWDFGPNQHVFVSRDDGKAAQIAISAVQMMPHPWHLHGQNFQVVGWGNGEFGKDRTVWNFKNPLRRDTVTIPGYSHLVIRFRAVNPGIWALHCHIQWHAEGGMFVTTAQRLGDLQRLLDSLDSTEKGAIRHRFCGGSSIT
ncbi:multicopper oxidase [Hypomontagnella monticulosa]|nr:multicopper oxidase [Hypomontagnella monticulosa]